MNGEANNDLNWRGRNEKSGLFKAEKWRKIASAFHKKVWNGGDYLGATVHIVNVPMHPILMPCHG
jgi:hypothetical protein